MSNNLAGAMSSNLAEAMANSDSAHPLRFILAPEIVNGINPALNYNPRCLTRDFNPNWSSHTATNYATHLLNCGDIDCLEKRIDGWEQGGNSDYDRKNNIHPAGHFAIGGLNNDPFSAPGDPLFFLYHGMLDRMWAFWQAQDPNARTYQVGGTDTPFNSRFPPSYVYLLSLTIFRPSRCRSSSY